jgi:hypothetical protein
VRQIITSLGRYMASPFAFLILFGYAALLVPVQARNLRVARRGDPRHLVHDLGHSTRGAPRHTSNSCQA